MPLTLEEIEKMKPGAFATGEVENSPQGVFMTREDPPRMLRWVAVRGDYPGWKIYIGWADRSVEYITSNGDKLTNEKYIKKLVPCTDEAFARYEY